MFYSGTSFKGWRVRCNARRKKNNLGRGSHLLISQPIDYASIVPELLAYKDREEWSYLLWQAKPSV